MPELPEVETVRRGLDTHLVGRRITHADIHHPRTARHNTGGAAEITGLITGHTIHSTGRRGKFLWLNLEDPTPDGALALVIHLGMSGQMLIKDADTPDTDPNRTHLRARALLDDGREAWFVDQRTFGYWRTSDLHCGVPDALGHIARDLIDDALDEDEVIATLRRRKVPIKAQLLDQTIVSGIGNIYADEMLWRARIHPNQQPGRIRTDRLRELLHHGRDVMQEAIAQGGTSFDDLYVNVNGQSGYFDRSLAAYGQAGKPCRHCHTPMVKKMLRGRSATFCPSCQRAR